ncbi:hypothetical protein IC757_09235 [Wenzhouxiangella sp. AB-CW3]|uniref:hypothetical protein n=1 Tax=Wenzhouxiangella sp. AB-CW3 TaxID=2771012 RepID=UPI00168B3E66|nr:hypothetical protein [Wenzhouxiangella sp. AB-CW3]QOC21238.1 hypothetical protein IC757_09235 [Wenzhouxiangella sp. AB-CW3]
MPARLVADRELGWAALTRMFDCPTDAAGIWLRADPVRLQPDLGAVWVDAGARLPPESPAARELIDLFHEEGMALSFADELRGYVRLESRPDVRFMPPWTLAGRSMELRLPVGPEQQRWRRLLSETQILLHQHAPSLPSLTRPGGLWFWGEGSPLPSDPVSPRVSAIQAHDPVLGGLARWLALPLESPGKHPMQPGQMLEWQADQALSAEDNLGVLERLLRRAWRALRLGRIHGLELADRQRVWRFGRLAAWSRWP